MMQPTVISRAGSQRLGSDIEEVHFRRFSSTESVQDTHTRYTQNQGHRQTTRSRHTENTLTQTTGTQTLEVHILMFTGY